MSFTVSAGAVRPPVDALVVGERPADYDASGDPGPVHRLDVEADQAVIEQQHRAGGDILRQLLIVEADARGIALLAVGVEDERLPGLQADLAFGEFSDADLRSLEIGHDRDFASQGARAIAHHLCALDVVRSTAMRKIEADDVDTGRQHPLQHGRLAARRSQRGDDFGIAWQGESLRWRFANRSHPMLAESPAIGYRDA